MSVDNDSDRLFEYGVDQIKQSGILPAQQVVVFFVLEASCQQNIACTLAVSKQAT